MQTLGEIISIGVAFSWTITALLSEYVSKRVGSVALNLWRMLFALVMAAVLFAVVLGSPLPISGSLQAYGWMMLSGFVGYVLADFCLMQCYIVIGSRYGQLFMTLSPLAAAFTAWVLLGQELAPISVLAILVTLSGIVISILGRGEKHRFSLKLPARGVVYASLAAIGQGIGLVLSKVGLNHYEASVPADVLNQNAWLLPFCANFFRCVAGVIGFGLLALLRGELSRFRDAAHDRKAIVATVATTIFGPFVGVGFSLMAVQYCEAGVASTLMALSPIIIIVPAHYIYHQPITWKGVFGALVSMAGVTLFFLA